jgi:hypothetical protein
VSQNITQWAGTTLAVPTNWGTAASGEVIGVNAELFAGSTALSATSTSLNVNLTGGTTAVTQSTSPWVMGGNKSVNTAAPGATSIGSLTAQANAVAQTWTEGFLVPLSTDLAGNLRVNATFSGTLSNNITQWNSVALGSPTAFGTAPTGNQIGVNASVFAGSTAITATSTSLNVNVTNPVAGPTSTTANALPGVNPVTVNGTSVAILSSNASRKECIIVNTGTTIIYLGLGATATTTAYHIVLAKCTVANDGTGSSWTSDMWKGSINAIGSTTGGTVVVTELT